MQMARKQVLQNNTIFSISGVEFKFWPLSPLKQLIRMQSDFRKYSYDVYHNMVFGFGYAIHVKYIRIFHLQCKESFGNSKQNMENIL